MEFTEENVNKVIDFQHPYAVANGGSIQFVGIESGSNIVKVRLTRTGDMTCERMLELIKEYMMDEIPSCGGVVQVL
tara:strand:+ start:42 stop:269 length:228 start_codon:yes stop_codon:yes gene_type:complete